MNLEGCILGLIQEPLILGYPLQPIRVGRCQWGEEGHPQGEQQADYPPILSAVCPNSTSRFGWLAQGQQVGPGDLQESQYPDRNQPFANADECVHQAHRRQRHYPR